MTTTVCWLLLAIAQAGADPEPNGSAADPARAPEPASRPASQPKTVAGGGTAADLTGEVTFIFELDEGAFRVQESWTLRNESGRKVDRLSFPMPKGTKLLRVDEGGPGFEANEASTDYATTGPLGPGQHSVSAAYVVAFSGTKTTVRRTIPVTMTSSRLIIEEVPGLSLSANVDHRCEPRDMNGLRFKVCTFDAVRAGGILAITFQGLPSHQKWPRTLAVAVSLGVLGWMIFGIVRGPTASTAGLSPISAEARRDQIVRALELLKEDFDEDRINDKRYERRKRELKGQLADVLRELGTKPARGDARLS